ncbi:hypothetical protein GH714_030821 [Hevea brasiliensis]|uniref:Protein kinase domain-containing protein n=1 Tax=Hevea brasiliensis TaxID=3981 RepID=A0A6A6NKI8_HEVBR|nr:hypothetical protein GH714_030821 [Hevea brasiliensis]
MELEITKVYAVFLHTFIWSLLGSFTATVATETDIACLKSIKASLEDPFGYLKSSWDFNNNTEGFICSFTGVDCWHPNENKVLNLRLPDMGLRGRFPLGIENCTSLTGLDLSGNEVEGPIPFDIPKRLPFVTSLDLSSNSFSGEIPSSIANCSHLNILKLDHNRLTGHIPQEIGGLSRIKVFSVSDNLLSGPVPNFANTAVSADDYANNNGLCGGPLRSFSDFRYSLYASYCVPWVYMGKKNGMITIPELISTSQHFVTRMSSIDLCNATGNFSKHNIIGVGQIGTMYKASLPNGWSLAVKKLYISEQSEEQFISELKTLGRLRHDNLIPLLGFCKEAKTRLLVYKYVSNGSLFDWLHSWEGKKKVLKWPLRMKIAAGIAKGLAWLHHCCSFRVAHLNISTKCILLDKDLDPSYQTLECLPSSIQMRSIQAVVSSWMLNFGRNVFLRKMFSTSELCFLS